MNLPLFSPYPSLRFPALILAGERQPSAERLHPGASKMFQLHMSLLCGGGENASLMEEPCFESFKNGFNITPEKVQSKTEPA